MNKQEALWAGKFGDDYTERQVFDPVGTKAFFNRALKKVKLQNFRILEFGASSGNNLKALRGMLPNVWLAGVEINDTAYAEMDKVADEAYLSSLLNFPVKQSWDLVFTKGVLIHISPDDLKEVFQIMYHCSTRYVLICEYFSPRFEAVKYRGQKESLWKGPYADAMLDQYAMKVLDYGFWWSKDKYPQDDITWFLMEK